METIDGGIRDALEGIAQEERKGGPILTDRRAAAIIAHRTPPTRRARSLAALMNYLVFGRWPGER